jgi:hypothetical protein
MDVASLSDRSKLLDELKAKPPEPLLVVRLDLLEKIIHRLEESSEIRALFGERPLEHLAVVWDKERGEVLIADANISEINVEKEVKFAKLLKDIIERNR